MHNNKCSDVYVKIAPPRQIDSRTKQIQESSVVARKPKDAECYPLDPYDTGNFRMIALCFCATR